MCGAVGAIVRRSRLISTITFLNVDRLTCGVHADGGGYLLALLAFCASGGLSACQRVRLAAMRGEARQPVA